MRAVIFSLLFFVLAGGASAQGVQLSDLVPEGDASFTGRIIQGMVALTVLSLAPGILIACTCFLRFIIAFSFLRSGLGMQSTPPNLILISLALFMTFFVMQPVFDRSWNEGIRPLMENQISTEVAFEKAMEPVKKFMLQNVRAKDVVLFEEARSKSGENATNSDEPDLAVLIPAYMLSELRRGFEIGFLILLPFLIIDLAVATVTMSMGMMMLPPTVVSLPFKILFFVLIDGWNIIVGELLESIAS